MFHSLIREITNTGLFTSLHSPAVFRKNEFNLYPFYSKRKGLGAPIGGMSLSRKSSIGGGCGGLRPFLHQYGVRGQGSSSTETPGDSKDEETSDQGRIEQKFGNQLFLCNGNLALSRQINSCDVWFTLYATLYVHCQQSLHRQAMTNVLFVSHP